MTTTVSITKRQPKTNKTYTEYNCDSTKAGPKAFSKAGSTIDLEAVSEVGSKDGLTVGSKVR